MSLHRMHVHRLIALVRVEMEPPTPHIKNGGHRFAIPLAPIRVSKRSSPAKPAVELDHPHSARAVDLAESCAVEPGRRTAQIDLVQGIEHVGADLQVHPFPKAEILAQAEIAG